MLLPPRRSHLLYPELSDLLSVSCVDELAAAKATAAALIFHSSFESAAALFDNAR